MRASAPICSVESLQALRAQQGGTFELLDTRFDLRNPEAGRLSFEAGHLPGAAYVHLDEDLCGPRTGRNGRHPLPDRAAFRATLGRLGIGPETEVVVMDQDNAMFAARLWWMLRWVGHTRVRVLDGGFAAWQAAGGAVETGRGPARQPAGAPPYPELPAGAGVIDADSLQARLGQQPLVDARAPERYRGDVEPLDAVAGHIPGAMNLPFAGNLGPDGRFLPAAALRERWAKLLGDRPQDVVHQCGSGVTACHNLLATELAGLPLGVLYAGSWSEWCSDPARPVARGDDTGAAVT